MKWRLLVVCAVLLVLFAAPAFADSITVTFSNRGILSGNLNSGVVSTPSDLAFDGTVLASGPFATLKLNLGSLTGGLLHRATSTGAEGNFELDSVGSVILVTAFSGTLHKIGDDTYNLIGNFSTVFDGVRYSGVTNQQFKLRFDDGRASVLGLGGTSTITATPVP